MTETPVADPIGLYDQDFLAWTQEQAARLRQAAASRVNAPIDWEHVAEEIEDLGKRERDELEHRLETIIEHLLKLQHSPAVEPRAGWVATIVRSRGRVEILLEDNPSLTPDITAVLSRAQRLAVKTVKSELAMRGELSAPDLEAIGTAPLDQAQVMGEWFPSVPPNR
ncbi:MAG TPA: DUF29 domain-containing protein [Acidisphaera sp.]|nr:DUF29 domain-containing protein [Acidisphaera sp.]